MKTIKVTDHAIARYAERVMGMRFAEHLTDQVKIKFIKRVYRIRAIKDAIKNWKVVAGIKAFLGSGRFPAYQSVFTAVVINYSIVTVLT